VGFIVLNTTFNNISQLIRYSRACVQYSDLLDRAQLLTQQLLKQGYKASRVKILQSSSELIWLLQNIHLINGN